MARAPETVGVLVLAYGGPDSLDEVEPFLRRVMAPREPSEEMVARAVARYQAIGGRSPLVENTLRQARSLQALFDSYGDDPTPGHEPVRFQVFPGMRHTSPGIDEAVRQAVEASDTTVIALIMASHQSERATGAYLRDVAASFDALDEDARSGMEPPAYVAAWHTSPLFLRAVGDRVLEALRGTDFDSEDVSILFTAHSLPLIDGRGDPDYEHGLLATAEGVMSLVGDYPWSLAYQSASAARGGRWLGPSAEDVIRGLAAAGRRKVVVVPVGFVSEHLETLYDLDIELAREAREAGVEMVRAATVQDSRKFIEALAESVVATQRQLAASRNRGNADRDGAVDDGAGHDGADHGAVDRGGAEPGGTKEVRA